PHGHGDNGHAKNEALPPLGIAIVGGLLAFWLLSPLALRLAGLQHTEEDAPERRWLTWAVEAAVGVAGAVVGWLLARPVNGGMAAFFRAFNWLFDVTIEGYGRAVGLLAKLAVIVLLVYGGLMALTYLEFKVVPTGFIPQQDKGYLVVNAQL